MKRKTYTSFVLLALVICSSLLISCAEKDLTTSTALKSIQEYLDYKPQYETTTIEVGPQKWRTLKDSISINHFKDLEKEGYLTINTNALKKKWLSKDSIWDVTLQLTEKAHPYVVSQKNNQVKVKTIEYAVGLEKPIEIHSKSSKSANITVMLIKNPTPFYILNPDTKNNNTFITKKYKLRFSDEFGWEVSP